MGCITSIAIALWLIVLAAGVFLLYKVQKENLQWPFKIAGWLITIVALGGMLCCSLRCMINSCHDKKSMMMYHHGMYRGECDDNERGNKDEKCHKNKPTCCKTEEECDYNIFEPFDLTQKTEEEFYNIMMKRYFDFLKEEKVVGIIKYFNRDLWFEKLLVGSFSPLSNNKIVCKGPAGKELSGCIYTSLKLYKCVTIVLEKDETYTVYTCSTNPQ